MEPFFVAVLVVLLSTVTGGSAANSCTASLPAVHGREDECPASGGGDLVNEINQNISALLQEVVHCMLQLGHTPEYPANSCTELAEWEPDIPSGNSMSCSSTSIEYSGALRKMNVNTCILTMASDSISELVNENFFSG